MRALRYGETIWVDVVLCGLAGPVTGIHFDDAGLRAEDLFSSEYYWRNITLPESCWREIGEGIYQLRLGPYSEGDWARPYLYWRVLYSPEPGVNIRDAGVVAHADTLAPPNGYEIAGLIADYLAGLITNVDDWHYGYIREHVPHKQLPAVDIAVTEWASEDAAGYRRWTGTLNIRIAAADAKRTSGAQVVSNLAADIITILQEANLESIPVDAIRNVRLTFGPSPSGAAVRVADITATIIMEV